MLELNKLKVKIEIICIILRPQTWNIHYSIGTGLDVEDDVLVVIFSCLPSSDIIIIINASGTVTRTNQTIPS